MARMAYVLALDQGTTSSRAILFDEAGAIAAVAQKEFQQFYPQAGLGGARPAEILSSQMSCAVEVLAQVGARPRDIAAIGITNQRETVIVWERATGKAIHPAIVWQDRRTAAFCEGSRRAALGEMVAAKTGLVLDPYFSATKVRWILDNVPGARARAERGELAFGTVDSWLIWHLTSGHKHVTDVTNASRTLLFNIVKGEWDAELLKLFGIPASMLPEVVWSSQRVGEVTTTLGLGGVPIAGIAGDQQAALFGQLCWSAGEAKNTYGTGCFLLQNIGTEFMRSRDKLITTVAASAAEAPRIRARGQHLHRRRGGAVAARQPEAHRLLGRRRSAGRERARHERRGLCAGVCGPRRAALGRARGRHVDRPAPRHQPRPHRARGARSHRLPGRRRARSRGQRHRRAAARHCASTAGRR